jgi:DNA-binding HxlR family transcriptional regulator
LQPLVETVVPVALRDIVFGDRRDFRELQANSIEGIASNILADRLKRLVKSGLLTREDTRPGQRARYSLTEPAIQLVPVFAQLGSWGTSPPGSRRCPRAPTDAARAVSHVNLHRHRSGAESRRRPAR